MIVNALIQCVVLTLSFDFKSINTYYNLGDIDQCLYNLHVHKKSGNDIQ